MEKDKVNDFDVEMEFCELWWRIRGGNMSSVTCNVGGNSNISAPMCKSFDKVLKGRTTKR